MQSVLGSLVYPSDPAGWYEVPPPKDGKAGYRALFLKIRDSDVHWFVSLDAKRERVVATKRTLTYPPKPKFELAVEEVSELYHRRPSRFLKVEDGWLVGYNGGEWGGAVWWFSEDGKKRYEVHRHCNPNQFLRTKDSVFVIEGLSHLGPSHGSVVKLSTKNGKWVSTEFAKLPAKGCAATDPGDGTLLVATAPKVTGGGDDGWTTSTKLVRVTKEGKVETLCDVADCFSEPTSVAVAPSGVVDVGMQQFVIACDPKAKPPAHKLLVPRKELLPAAK